MNAEGKESTKDWRIHGDLEFRVHLAIVKFQLLVSLTLYGRMSTTGNIAKLFSEKLFPDSVKYQSHIATIKDIYCAICSSII